MRVTEQDSPDSTTVKLVGKMSTGRPPPTTECLVTPMRRNNPNRGKSPDTTAMNSIEIDARDVLAGRWDTIRLGGER